MQIRPLDKGSHRPLYLQLVESITDQIGAGSLKPGDRIPSERELALQLGVSRITARLALDALYENGLVYREQGRGTFVAESKMRGLKGFLSFTEDIVARGLTPRSHILRQEVIAPDAATAAALKCGADERVLALERLRLADDEPVALQYSFLPLRIAPGLETIDLTDRSLFTVLREQFFVYPFWTEAQVEAVPASESEAERLGVAPGAPLLEVNGLTFTESFEIVESVRTVYRACLPLYIGRQRL